METLTIMTNSVVCPLITGTTMAECCRIKRLCNEKVVDLCFFGDEVRITGEKTRKMKVPAKALKNGEALVKWMEERIEKAWS